MVGLAMQTFGEWLYEARKSARFSQDELATRANISKNYISRIERNGGHPVTGALPQPSREVVKSLAAALGKPVNEALDAAEAMIFYQGIPPHLKPVAKVMMGEYKWEYEDNYDYIRGNVVNYSKRPVSYWLAQCHFYDKSGAGGESRLEVHGEAKPLP